jgi:Cu-Zn family superoxide dismutase
VHGPRHGLKPNQEHGFHVHEKGDCSSGDGHERRRALQPDGQAARAPERRAPRGRPAALKADASGRAVFRFRIPGNILAAGPRDFAGKAVIVHAMPDDYTTQPTATPVPAWRCGVIASARGQDASDARFRFPPTSDPPCGAVPPWRAPPARASPAGAAGSAPRPS